MFFFWIFRGREKTAAERERDRQLAAMSFLIGLILMIALLLWL